jgi:Protein of unknown function (DUF2946)
MKAATMQRQVLARVILTLLLAAALVPTLSRALTQSRGNASPWAEGCIGTAPAAVALNPTPADTEAWHHLLEHCPLCSLDRDLPHGLLPASPMLPLLALADAGPATGWAQPQRRPQARWRVQPRAPPYIS